MIVYRVYNEQGGYIDFAEQPQGVEFEIIDKTPSAEEIAEHQLKQQLEQQKTLKQQQYEELKETDWYFTRFIETGIPVPEEILEQRKQIRNKYNNDEDK